MPAVNLVFALQQLSSFVAFLLPSLAAGSPLYFTRHPQSAVVKAGSNFQLTCEAVGTQPITYSWLQGGKELAALLVTQSRVNIEVKNGTVHFKPFLFHRKNSLFDMGEYQCIASNQDGKAFSLPAMVQSHVLSTFRHSAKYSVVAPGDMVRLYGSAAWAVPPPSSTWKMNGIALMDGDRSQRLSIFPNGVLHIKNMSSVDVGNYTLTLSNVFETKTFSKSYVASVRIGPVSSPCTVSVELPSPHVEVKMGDDATIEAVIHNTHCITGQLSVHWEKDGSMINKATTKYTHQAYSLVVRNILSTDTGNYTVVVTYDSTTLRKTALLTALIQPSVLPALAREQEVTTFSNISVTCTVSGSPMPDIVWYKNTVKVVDDGKHIRLESTNGRLRLVFESFTASDDGVYQCVASNTAGVAIGTTKLEARGVPSTSAPQLLTTTPSAPHPMMTTSSAPPPPITTTDAPPPPITTTDAPPPPTTDAPPPPITTTDAPHPPTTDAPHPPIRTSNAPHTPIRTRGAHHPSVTMSDGPQLPMTTKSKASLTKAQTQKIATERSSRSPPSTVPINGTEIISLGDVTDDFLLVAYIVAPIAGVCAVVLFIIILCICCQEQSEIEETPNEKPGWIPQTDSGKGVELQSYEHVSSTPVSTVPVAPVYQDGLTQSPKLTGNGYVSGDTGSGSDTEDDSKGPVMQQAVAVLPIAVAPPQDKDDRQSEPIRQLQAVLNLPRRTTSLRKEAPPVAPKPKQRASMGSFPEGLPSATTPAPQVNAKSLPRHIGASTSQTPGYANVSIQPSVAASQTPGYTNIDVDSPVSTSQTPGYANIDVDSPSASTSQTPVQPTSVYPTPVYPTPFQADSQQRFQPLKKRMSRQEKDMLDSMIDELITAPSTSQEHPPDPPPSSVPAPLQSKKLSSGLFDMQRLLGSGPEVPRQPKRRSQTWFPPPPPAPPPTEDFPDLPADLPAPSRELQGSPGPKLISKKTFYNDDLDDIMKQLELDAENLDSLIDSQA